MRYRRFPKKQGLYDPQFEHDSCGVGFVCNIKGAESRDIVRKGINVLERLSHRGAVGSDPKTGDGAGILIQTPHEFFAKIAHKAKIALPEKGKYAAGLVFLPINDKERAFCKRVFFKVIKKQEQILLGWRKVPVDNSVIGRSAKETEPVIEQIFIAKDRNTKNQLDFERKLYIIRKQIQNIIRASNLKQKSFFYITNISSRTFSYKGLLMPEQVENFFIDLQDEDIKSAIVLVHSRYSTNTFPTWDLAQPFRFLAHNGEINTLRGNINWMRAREGLLSNSLFKKDIEKIKPIIVPGESDSATLDNVFELLILSGRSLAHAMMMLIPSAWEGNKLMNRKLRDFYKYHSCLIEPWDGPAAIAFTDGARVGAVLDRNGLRPARYVVTKKDLVVMASEVGVLDIKPADILYSGRLEPGKMLFIDVKREKIVSDDEVKKEISGQKPYGAWIKKYAIDLNKLPDVKTGRESFPPEAEKGNVVTLMKSFGYTREDLKFIIGPMAETGKEPIGSMGNDTPHAVLSKKPRLLYGLF